MIHPKYTHQEIERRWLVAAHRAPALPGEPIHIHDRYLDGARLRLRRVTEVDGRIVYKFCKKYAAPAGVPELITNLYLEEAEFQTLSALPGQVVDKVRYGLAGGSLDHYQRGPDELLIYEREFASVAECGGFTAPAFAGREITGHGDFSGAALARRFGRHDPP